MKSSDWTEEQIIAIEDRINSLNLLELIILKAKLQTMIDLAESRQVEIYDEMKI